MNDWRYRETEQRDWVKTGAFIAAFVLVISAGAFLLLPQYWPAWAFLLAAGSAALMLWHSRAFAYRCAGCGEEFEISLLTDFISPHGIDRDGEGCWRGYKYLKCPNCRQRSKAVGLAKR
jgi:DNA-directed RNA polymerase subunit RPC12/RpoP